MVSLIRLLSAAALALIMLGCSDDGMSTLEIPQFQGDGPTKRSDISGVADPTTGTMAVFGGDDGPIVGQFPIPKYRADTWLFDPTSGWADLQIAGPSARGRHATALDPNAGRMLLFGGRYRLAESGPYTLYNDLWAFDFTARTWTEVDDGTGAAPAPRIFPAAAYDPATDKYFVWGGSTSTDGAFPILSNEVWSYSAGAWQQEFVVGSPTPQRLFVAYTYDSQRNWLVIYGGQVGDFVSAAETDLHALDLDTLIWSELHSGIGTGPPGRFSAMLTYDPARDRYLMTGGHGDAGVLNDVWEFNPGDGMWLQYAGGDVFTGGALGCGGNPREIPATYIDQDLAAPERRSGGIFQYLGGYIWMFGGESDCSDHLDDTWAFDPASGQWGEGMEATSGESCLRRNDACECLCL